MWRFLGWATRNLSHGILFQRPIDINLRQRSTEMSVSEASQLSTVAPLRFDTEIRHILKQVESPARDYQIDSAVRAIK